jgi:hypothetical protein
VIRREAQRLTRRAIRSTMSGQPMSRPVDSRPLTCRRPQLSEAPRESLGRPRIRRSARTRQSDITKRPAATVVRLSTVMRMD